MSENDPRFIAYKAFMHAMQFHRASQRCAETREMMDQTIERLSQPSIVNLAFAVELYLKAIFLKQNGTPAHGHNLKNLFEALEAPDRAGILRQFDALDRSEHNFQAELADAALIFNTWRYSHEVASISSRTLFLSHLAHALMRHGETVIDGDFDNLNDRLRWPYPA